MPTAPRMRLARRLLSGAIALALFAVRASAQGQEPAALLREFSWRSLGPTNLGGRVDDVEGVPSNPAIVYMGGANSGVWKTTNGGTTWAPIFDGQPNLSYYLKAPTPSAVKVQVVDVLGRVVREFDAPQSAGIHRIEWDLRGPPREAPAGAGTQGVDPAALLGARVTPGTYAVRLVANGRTSSVALTVLMDPNR